MHNACSVDHSCIIEGHSHLAWLADTSARTQRYVLFDAVLRVMCGCWAAGGPHSDAGGQAGGAGAGGGRGAPERVHGAGDQLLPAAPAAGRPHHCAPPHLNDWALGLSISCAAGYVSAR